MIMEEYMKKPYHTAAFIFLSLNEADVLTASSDNLVSWESGWNTTGGIGE